MSIRARLILLLSVIMIIMAGGVFLFFYQEQARHEVEYIAQTQELLYKSIESVTVGLNERYSGRLQGFLEVNHRVIKAFADHDRELLLSLSKLPYAVLQKSDPSLNAMYYILPDNTVFLRVHKPDFYGDEIVKISQLAVQVNLTRKTLSSIENVKTGQQYRICQPVFSEGEYVGMVGVNIDIHSILHSEIRDGSIISLLFTKKQTEHMEFLIGQLQPLGDFFLYPDADPLFLQFPVKSYSKGGETVKVNDRTYTVFIGNSLRGIQGNEIGKVLVASDITDFVTRHLKRTISILSMLFALLIILGTALYFGIGKVLKRVRDMQVKLKEQNLLLENTVEKRTEQLQEKVDQYAEINRRYKQLTENSPNWIWEVDDNFIITYSNSQIRKLLGYSPEEVIGTYPLTYISRNDHQRVKNFWNELTHTPKAFTQFECVVLHKNGSEVIVNVDADPLLSKEGELFGYRARVEDITSDVKKREQQGFFTEAFRSAEDAIFLLENDHFIDCNAAAVSLFAASSRKNLLQLHPATLSPEFQADGANSIEKSERLINYALKKSFLRFEWLHKKQNGVVFPCEVTLTRIILNEKIVLHVTLRDLSKLKKEQLDLLVFKEAIEQSFDGIAISNLDGNVQFVNSSWATMHGYESESLIGKALRIFHTEKQLEEDVIPFNTNVMLNGFNSGEVWHCTKTGHPFPTYRSVSLIKDAFGVPKGFVASAHDITEQKKRRGLVQAIKAAEIANQAKTEFLANMSHELRTPMHGILSYAAFGIDRVDKVSREKLHEYFLEIADSGNRLMLLLNDLLDLAKLEAGKMNYSMDIRDVGLMLEICIAEFKTLAYDKRITLHYQPPRKPLTALFDYNRIGQVIRNLLSNAIKFSRHGKIVRISCSEDTTELNGDTKPAVRITVTDEGIGVPFEELESIFNKFIQSSKTKNGAGGTGLGLPICKEIVANHDGAKIWAENNPNGGTILNLVLLGK